MRRIFRCILLSCVLVLGLSSCDFDHLYYETNLKVLVRIDVDWNPSQYDANGVSAYVYDSSGDLYTKLLSANADSFYLKLPSGNYTVVLHNNSISEIDGVGLRGMSSLASSSVSALERGDDPAFAVEGDSQLFVQAPGDVLSCTLRDIEILASDVEYHYYKPDLSEYEQECFHVYRAVPMPVVHRCRVIARVGGLQYSLGTPVALLRGMSGGYGFDPETTTDADVMQQFKVNTRLTKVDADADDTIFVDYNTFGMHQRDSASQLYYLDVRFTLLDGSYQDYHLDVTDSIRTEVGPIRNLHIVSVDLGDLPEVDDGGDPPSEGDEGTFDPTLDQWVDVEVDLPM